MEEKVIQLKDLQPGSSYLVRARVINQYGVASEWSETYTLNIVKDDLKPSIPATPTVNLAGPQKVVVIHDNKKKVGGDLEFDVVSYKVFTNTTQSNTGGTLIHTMSATRPGSGIDSFATINVNAPLVSESGATVYFYVTAVDSAGNESDPSDATTGKAITYFDSAYISDLTADRIRTGTLQANQQISVGTTAPIVIKSNTSSPRGQIYVGTTSNPTGEVGSGFKDPQTAFYVDSTGKFSLKDKLTWDGTTLKIDGYFEIGDNETTIGGDQIRSGNIISNNYLSDTGSETAQSTTFTQAGTWFDLDTGALYSKGFYITGTGDKDPFGNTIAEGTAVFKGEIFGARGIFSDQLSEDVSDSLNLEYSDTPGGPVVKRKPTLVVESTNTNDGYLVLFKTAGYNNGVEFYVKQATGDGSGETDQKNWRRGSLAHIGDNTGGFLRLGAFPSSTGKTPGRIRIFAESSPDGPKGEIYLDAKRTFVQNIYLKEPSTTGDWLNDPLTNFWKDPSSLTGPIDYFKVGSVSGSAISVRKRADGTDKVIIKDYEIEGVSQIVDDSKITVNTVEIGKGVGGAGKHGIKIDANNYWYDPATLGSSDVVFRAGWIGDKKLEVRKDGSVLFEGDTNPTGGEIKGLLVIKNVAADTTFSIGKNVISERDGIKLNDNNYWTISQTGLTANFKVGGSSRYLEWTGSQLNISTDTVLIGGVNAATTNYADSAASSAAAAISVLQKFGTEVTGVTITSLGEIFSAGKTSYSDTDNGWYLGWINPISNRTPAFNVGNASNYMRWTGSTLEVSGTIISGSTMPGGQFSGGTPYGSGVSFAGNKVFITDEYGGIITFSDGISTAFGSIGSATASGKFSGFEAGSKAIMIGQAGYPQIEIGKDSTNANKILLYTAANVGLEIRPANFILRGGTASRIRGIPSSSSAPSGKKVLYGDENENLEWGPASGGGGGSSIPAGSITMYGGVSAPSGWLLCNGQAVSRSTFSDLFSAIGTSYGAGNGSTTFNVPDFISGGPGGTPAFPRGGNTPGNTGGQASFTLTVDNIPQHSHGNGSLAIGGSLGGSGALSHSGTMDEKGGHTHSSLSATNSTQNSHDHGVGTYTISGSTGSGGAHSHTYTIPDAAVTGRSGTGNLNVVPNRSTGATTSNEPSHTHGAGTLALSGSSGLGGNHTHTVTFDWTNAVAGSHRHTVTIDDHPSHTHSVTGLTVTGTTGNWGTASPTSINNQPPFIVVNFIIKT